MSSTEVTHEKDFASEVSEEAGFRVRDCYQCGKCTAGCPTSYLMDYPIHRVMLMTIQGKKDELLRARSIWLCVSCETCTTRCPKECKPSVVMDVLRGMSIKEGKMNREEKQIIEFHRSFLKSVRDHGVIHEMGLLFDYKMLKVQKTFNPVEDMYLAKLAPKMLFAGKIHLLPRTVNDIASIGRIFDKYYNW